MPCSSGEKSVLSTCSVSGKKRQCSEFSSTLSTLICAAHSDHLRHRLQEESYYFHMSHQQKHFEFCTGVGRPLFLSRVQTSQDTCRGYQHGCQLAGRCTEEMMLGQHTNLSLAFPLAPMMPGLLEVAISAAISSLTILDLSGCCQAHSNCSA